LIKPDLNLIFQLKKNLLKNDKINEEIKKINERNQRELNKMYVSAVLLMYVYDCVQVQVQNQNLVINVQSQNC